MQLLHLFFIWVRWIRYDLYVNHTGQQNSCFPKFTYVFQEKKTKYFKKIQGAKTLGKRAGHTSTLNKKSSAWYPLENGK